jgi:P-type E1-E2 ATPase
MAWVALGPAALGVVALADLPRVDARDAVVRLRGLARSVALVSGDHGPAVALAADRAGIASRHSEVTPESKVEHVARLRSEHSRVLVAGDGINDAAALAAADVGVAMAQGADVTLHAADIVVRAPRLSALADTIALARATMRRIRENLGLALAYNVVAIPLAMTGVLQPLHAAIAMSLSSVVVTANAARLLKWRPRS